MTSAKQAVKLGSVVDLLPGFAFKSDAFTEDLGDICLVKGENVSQGRILWEKSKRWPISSWNDGKLCKYKLQRGDVIVAMDRPWVPAGLKWAFIRSEDPASFLVQRCCRLRTKSEHLDQGFLRFLIGGPSFDDYIRPITTGVNVPHISGEQILGFQFNLPPVCEQRRIAGILSAYDDLIENCQRRIKILEEMARNLYREWFVHFRYPGHESVALGDSLLGPIPTGWTRGTIADLCSDVSYGYTASAQIEDVGPKFLRITDIVPETIEWARVPHCRVEEGRIQKYILSESDIVIARTGATTGYAKRINKRHPTTVFASYLVRIRPRPSASKQALGILVQSEEYKRFILSNIGGSAQPQANAKVLTSMPVVIPPTTIARSFDSVISPIVDVQELLGIKVANLRKTRDVLLPKLIGGS